MVRQVWLFSIWTLLCKFLQHLWCVFRKQWRHKTLLNIHPKQTCAAASVQVLGGAGRCCSTSLSTDKEDTCIYCINIPGCAWVHIHTHTSWGKDVPPPRFDFVGFPHCPNGSCCSEQSKCEVTSPLCPPLQHKPFVCSTCESIMNVTTAAERQSRSN